ncbi:MAG TPA: CRISPR-associated protein Csx20 [Syntrophobacteraceae bacterium]|nr:CRISPR-associated protein Csx20 [Syntrophobacteraceae bacterium]
MAKNLVLLFNHSLTPAQEAEARETLGVSNFLHPPESVRELWRNIPPEAETLAGYLAPVEEWVKEAAKPGDAVLIQGDFGATCLMVRFAREIGLDPVYSTTERRAVEEPQPDGSIRLIHHFRHKRFRRYGG